MVYIHKGDKVAHYGDAWRDAHLYEPGGRSDIDSFRELYGFFPTILKNMDRRFSPGYNERKKKTKEETNNLTATSPAMFLINRHATRYAEKNRPPSKDFHDSFALFIKSYKEYEFPIEYRNDGHPLNTYHLNFLKNC